MSGIPNADCMASSTRGLDGDEARALPGLAARQHPRLRHRLIERKNTPVIGALAIVGSAELLQLFAAAATTSGGPSAMM